LSSKRYEGNWHSDLLSSKARACLLPSGRGLKVPLQTSLSNPKFDLLRYLCEF